MNDDQIGTSEDIKQLGTILTVWAHPDDETFTAGGILAAAVANGQKVICVTATRGEAGIQDESRWPASKLADIRAAELKKALEILGIEKHYWLGYKDGHCESVDQTKAAGQIRDFITPYQPDSILTFGPEGFTGHSDHKTVSLWTAQAVSQLKSKPKVYHAVQLREIYEQYLKRADASFNIFFNIEKPPLKDAKECDIYYKLTKEISDKKCQALVAMPSQTERLVKHFGDELPKALAYETFILAS
jgi:LmbE family N-acetylglucosaminyl deacetylase